MLLTVFTLFTKPIKMRSLLDRKTLSSWRPPDGVKLNVVIGKFNSYWSIDGENSKQVPQQDDDQLTNHFRIIWESYANQTATIRESSEDQINVRNAHWAILVENHIANHTENTRRTARSMLRSNWPNVGDDIVWVNKISQTMPLASFNRAPMVE